MASRRLNSFLALALFSAAFAHAQIALPSEIPVDEWLRGPDRHDFPWKVKIRDPWLTFQQRHTVQVHADFRLRDLKKHGISADDLHLLLKVADSDGKWLPGEAYSPLEIKPEYGNEVDTVATFYARPGKFKVALIAYDARNHRGNLWRGELTVPALKGDPLPNADLSLPVIQFLPQATVARSTRRFGSQRTLFDASAFGKGRLTLPVDNERPVQVDIVANLALSDAANTPYREAPDWMYKINADTLLQISNVLSQVDLKNGCVRFSAIDILRQKTFIERQNAATIDWDKIIQLVEDFERVKIEARVLASQKQTADAFAKLVEKLLDDPGCEISGPPCTFSSSWAMRSSSRRGPPCARCASVRKARATISNSCRSVPAIGIRWKVFLNQFIPLASNFRIQCDSVKYLLRSSEKARTHRDCKVPSHPLRRQPPSQP